MKLFKRISIILFALTVWTAFVGYGFIDGFLLKPLNRLDSPEGFIQATQNAVQESSAGNMAISLIEDGQVVETFFHSVDKPIDQNTVFPVASISKWVTSFGVMKLVEQGRLDLDQPVDRYLTRWHLPKSEFDNGLVTVRRLLSHSAGLIDELGYNGFPLDQEIQTLEESLTRAADADYSDGVAIVGYQPGTQYRYSGAGYTLMQLLIEEISGQAFEMYMKEEVLDPLGMHSSTFAFGATPKSRLAQIFMEDGTTREMNRFTALAAAGLYTTTADLSKFLQAQLTDNPVLSKETITLQSQAEAFINNIGVYGLGPHLYSQNDQNSLIIGHDGSGNAINTAARIDLKTGSGVVLLETGHWSMASSLADEWMFWKAGIADYVVMQRNKSYLLTLWAVGCVAISGFFLLMIRRKHKRSQA